MDGYLRELFEFGYKAVIGRFKRGKVDIDSCAATAAEINDRLTAEFVRAKQSGSKIACKAGCHYCCSTRVEVAAYEAIGIVRYLQTKLPKPAAERIQRKILANADRIEQVTPEQHRGMNLECALLVDGMCSVYPVRPLLCAGHHSCDVRACEGAFNHPDKTVESIPMLASLTVAKGALPSGTAHGLKAAKLQPYTVELHTALAALHRDGPRRINRWRTGNKLITDVPDFDPTSGPAV